MERANEKDATIRESHAESPVDTSPSVGVYAHSARWVGDICFFDVSVSPEDDAAHAKS